MTSRLNLTRAKTRDGHSSAGLQRGNNVQLRKILTLWQENMRVDPLFFMVLVWLAMLLVCTPSTVAEGGHARRTKRQFGFSGGVNAVRPITGALLSVTSSNRRPYRPNIIYGPRPTRRRCLHYDRYRRCIYWSRY
nr:uncharacterized protein LOC113829794 isoform X2 [Penaeus vannamei]